MNQRDVACCSATLHTHTHTPSRAESTIVSDHLLRRCFQPLEAVLAPGGIRVRKFLYGLLHVAFELEELVAPLLFFRGNKI